MVYSTYFFRNQVNWSLVRQEKLQYFNWENENPYRPGVFFQLAFTDDSVHVKMHCNETDLRQVCTNTNDPCWEDSCLEFFLAPFGKDKGYINIECNPKGVYLSEFGKGKYDRVYLNTMTKLEPKITATVNKDGWGVEIVVPYTLIEEVFGRKFSPLTDNFWFDAFKCGDKTSHPHYVSLTQMGELPPGFHNPECFCKAKVSEFA